MRRAIGYGVEKLDKLVDQIIRIQLGTHPERTLAGIDSESSRLRK